jgi:cytoskeletal protein CcmA (bactofilin family)
MWFKRVGLKENKSEDRLVTIIGSSTALQGNLNITGSAKIDGQVEGNIFVSELIIIGPQATIKGDVNCKNALIAGRVEGNVFAQMNIELQSGAYILGDLTCQSLIINKNCFFEGRSHMLSTERS